MTEVEESRPKRVKSGGRKKGTPNKTTAFLKDAILRAAELAGGDEGLIGYLQTQAKANPAPFLALLGKVLPLQLTGDKENPVAITRVELVPGGPEYGDGADQAST